MGCTNSSSIEEINEDKKGTKDKKVEKVKIDKSYDSDNKIEVEKENDSKKDDSKKEDKKEEEEAKEEDESEKDKNKDDKKNNKKNLEIKTTEIKQKGEFILSTDENKNISNINTEGVFDSKKMNLHKQKYEGVTLMKGVEEYIPEELNQDEVYNLVEESLFGFNTKDDNKGIGEISKEQAKAIASILYKKIHKEEIDMKDYPELKGLTVNIGIEKLTKEVIRKMMFNGKKIDDCQIDLTYANLTKDDEDIKALTIELLK